MLGACRARVPLSRALPARRVNLRLPANQVLGARLAHSTTSTSALPKAIEGVNQGPVSATSSKPAPATAEATPAVESNDAPTEEPAAAAKRLLGHLQGALETGNFSRMSQLWDQWQKRRLAHPKLYARCCTLIRRAPCTPPPEGLTRLQHSGLNKLALDAAALGELNGVIARMAYYLESRKPDTVLNLAKKLDAAMLPPGTGNKADSPAVAVPSTGVSDTGMTKIKACTIAACVMKDTFDPLLRLMTLGTTGSLQLNTLLFWAASIATDCKLSMETATSWAKRYHTLSVVSLSLHQYREYIARLVEQAKDGNGKPIQAFVRSIVRELRREDGYLRLNFSNDSTAAENERPAIEFTVDRCAHLMGMLIRSGDEEATRLFDEGMSNVAGAVPPAVHAAVLGGLAKVGRFDEAQRAWEAIGTEARTANVYDAYIHGLIACGKRDEALARFEEFEKLFRSTEGERDPAATGVFNRAIMCLADSDRLAEAQAVLERMKTMGPAPDVTSYNILLREHVRRRDTAAARAVLKEKDARNIFDDLDTAALVLTALHPTRRDAAALVLRRLRRSGVYVTPRTCITLFTQHLSRVGSDDALDAAPALLAHLDGIPPLRPTADTFSAVLCAAERHAWADAERGARMRAALRADMARRGVTLRYTHIAHLVSACRRNGSRDALERAVEYYREHRAGAPAVSYLVWTVLMDELVRRQEWEWADEVAYDLSSEAVPVKIRELLGRVMKRDPTWTLNAGKEK